MNCIIIFIFVIRQTIKHHKYVSESVNMFLFLYKLKINAFLVKKNKKKQQHKGDFQFSLIKRLIL